MDSSKMEPDGPSGRKLEIKHGEWLSEAWALLLEDLGDFLQVGLICWLISVVAILPCGIPFLVIGGPLTVGLIYYCQKKNQRKPTETNDLFFGFKHHFADALIIFAPVVLAGITASAMIFFMLNFMPFLGTGAATAVGVALSGIGLIVTQFALMILLEGQHDGIGCLKKTIEIIQEEPVQLLIYGFIGGLIYTAGVMVLSVGTIITMPLATLMMVIAYREVTEQLADNDA